MRRAKPILVAAAAITLVALLGMAATKLDSWYYGLRKPAWQPPDWLFGPAWTLIYVLTAFAGVRTWNRLHDHQVKRRTFAVLFGVNALLNVLWSELFFGLQRPDWALLEVVPFWLSILALVVVLWPVSQVAGLALLPYLAWVAFAGVLNLAIVRLNAPFAA